MKQAGLFIIAGLSLCSCGANDTATAPGSTDTVTRQTPVPAMYADSLRKDSSIIKESSNEDDLPVNEYLTDKLKPVRANFRRINSVTQWTAIETKSLWESTEGGEAKFYYTGKQLEKIVVREYGEMYQRLTEYYLLNNQLSFVFEKQYKYNRPMYYDSAAMKAGNDTEAFDFDKSQIIEDRSYFDKGQLIHQLNNEDCGSPFNAQYLQEEQKRIKAQFDKLIKEKKINS